MKLPIEVNGHDVLLVDTITNKKDARECMAVLYKIEDPDNYSFPYRTAILYDDGTHKDFGIYAMLHDAVTRMAQFTK